MRFELFLTELPKAPAAKVQSALSELPKGASTGTIMKAVEARKVPTVSVAWSEDKRVLNEVMDTLVDLGAGVKLVDHGSLVQKLATFAAEKAGRARYVEDDDDPDSRRMIKMSQRKKRGESISEAMTRHVIIYFLQLFVASVLFIWYVALRVGMERVFSTPGLWPQLLACAIGLLVSYVCTSSVRAMQAGQLTLPRILPQLVVGGALTIASLFFLGEGLDEGVADGKVKRPPSLPYAGLLSELHRRKLAKEATGHDGEQAGEDDAEQVARADDEEDALWCERPEPVETATCEGGRAWEEALACLPKPEPIKAPTKPRKVAKRKPVVSEEDLYLPDDPTAVKPSADRAWGLTLQLSTVLALAGMWILSLLGLFLQLRPRLVAAAASRIPEAAAEDEAAQEPVQGEEQAFPVASSTGTHEAPPAELTAVQKERDVLRAQLDEALTALVSGQGASGASPEPFGDESQTGLLRRDLGLARGALATHQQAIAELKRELTQVAMRESALQVELSELRLELGQEAELPEPARPAFDAHADNDGGGRRTGLTRQLPSDADDRSYSVNQVQEERVVLGKRQRP